MNIREFIDIYSHLHPKLAMNHSIELMPENNLKAASKSLARAFMNDPLQTYVFPDEEERKEKSPLHFGAILQYGLKFGEVYASNNVKGAVVLLRPGETVITPEKAEQGGLGQLTEQLGEESTTRFFSVIDFLDSYHRKEMIEPHWFTMVVGVDPIFHRKGLGKALFAPVLEKAHVKKESIYLETAEPSNIFFYTILGFRIVKEFIEPHSGLKLWTFRLDN